MCLLQTKPLESASSACCSLHFQHVLWSSHLPTLQSSQPHNPSREVTYGHQLTWMYSPIHYLSSVMFARSSPITEELTSDTRTGLDMAVSAALDLEHTQDPVRNTCLAYSYSFPPSRITCFWCLSLTFYPHFSLENFTLCPSAKSRNRKGQFQWGENMLYSTLLQFYLFLVMTSTQISFWKPEHLGSSSSRPISRSHC